MLSVTKDPKGFGLVTVNGRIDANDMRKGLDDFMALLPEDGQVPFLYDIREFAFPDMEAIVEKLRDLPSLFGAIGKINKIAMVADPAWLRTIAEIEGALVPGLSIRSFEPDKRDEAEAWLLSGD